ncbi:MAG: FxsA family protein [Rhodospirillales bacterium]|nr:FxsA family protein [Rhodospirillales bacterium]MBO6787619.1 FxsA family protein [Rhodospirillales bacterium]
MAFILLIAFITVPIIEIAVFIQVGEQIGLWSTIGIVILTAVIGTAMLRQQGLSVLFRIQENLQANRMPVQELFDGVCLVIAGALLLTPGFVTDSIGFLLFIPPFRHWLATEIGRRVIARADVRYTSHTYSNDGGHPGAGRKTGGPVIDGEYQDVTDTDPDDVPPEHRIGDDGPRHGNSG